MFKEVTVRNFALIDDITVKFEEGLNIIMGETGSGKSNLIDSISILLGERAQKEKIRKGKDSAFISGAFDISKNKELKSFLKRNNLYEESEDILIITRELSKSSSNVSRINNIIVPLSLVDEVSNYLIDIYGQFENITILSRSAQRDFIDLLGPKTHQKLLLSYKSIYDEYNNAYDEYINYKKTPEEVNRNLEFLMYQIEDIENSGVLNINEEELEDRLSIIEKSQDLKNDVAEIISLFDKNDINVISSLGKISYLCEDITRIDKNFIGISERLTQLYIESDDLSGELFDYFESLDFDEEEYRELDQKRSILFDAKRKYGDSISEILNFYDKAKLEVENIKNYELNLEKKKEKVELLKSKLFNLAEEMTNSRKNITKKFTTKLKKQLEELEMNDTEFKVDFKDTELNNKGKDELNFMISFNKNEPLREFSSVASGGEISRFMLAIKSIEAALEKTPTIIFDEIDAGISGNAGNIVGKKLKNLSKEHQLIVISHLPQIISKGDEQFLIYKDDSNEKVSSNIKRLSYEERIVELAKVIEGDNYSKYTLNTAKNMIDDNYEVLK